MELKLKGYPNARQKEFFLATTRHIGYGGARGGGKSWAMRRKFVLLALRYPNLRLLLLRRTLPELRENHILPLQQELYNFAKYKGEEKAFIFPNGSRIKLGYCDTESDIYQYQGQEYEVIGLEEATHFTESQKDFLTTCNRSTRSDFTPRMYYTANPGNVGHQWFKRLFIDKDYQNKEKAEDYIFIPAKVYDNKILMDNNPEYVEALENLPEELRKAHLEGDWDIFAGQYFREFRREKHVIEPFAMPTEWKRFCSIDWGYNDPCAVLWHIIGPDRRLYTYRELYIRETNATEVAKQILELSANEEIDYIVMSPDAWAKRGTVDVFKDGIQGESIAELMQNVLGDISLIKADNNRLSGWHRVHEYLSVAPDGLPYWQIFNVCQNLIRTLPGLIHDEHKVEDVSDKCEDHAPESARYGLMSRPSPMEVPKKPDYDYSMEGRIRRQLEKLTNPNQRRPEFL